MPSGFTASLPDDVLLDTGVLYVGNSSGLSISPVGVTRGGVQFSPEKEMRNIEFDGKRAPIAELDRVIAQGGRISGTFITFGTVQIPRFEPGATVDNAGPFAGGDPANVSSQIVPKESSTPLAAGDYIRNLRLVFLRGNGDYVQIRMPWALCERWEISGEDNSEAEITAEFVGRLGLTDAATSTDAPVYYIEELSALQS